MFINYLKIAWRNIIRSKGYSALNILGLGIGMAVALLIGLWVNYQYSFDKFLPNHARLYQVRRDFNANGEILNFTSTSLKLVDGLRNGYPEFAHVAETDGGTDHGLMVGEKKIQQSGKHVNAAFLEMFPFPLVKGNAKAALNDAYSIVLSESTAKALFGNDDPMNKFVRLDNQSDLKVTGILKDLPPNSTQQFSYLIPFAHLEQTQDYVRRARAGDYGNNAFETFAELKPGALLAVVAGKIRNLEKTELKSSNAMNSEVVLQPMDHWHLYGNYKNRKELGGFLQYVQMFTLIGAFVLLIACINFINLTTARSEKRAREVGVRKAIGSLRRNLIVQFLTESFLLTFFSFALALLLTGLLLPAFNALTRSYVKIPFGDSAFWLATMSGVILTAFLAGSRPAFYLSGFRPVDVLKGRLVAGRTGSLSRKMLVVVQFSCSIALIISSVIIYRQIQYAQNRPTGYNINRLMITDIGNSQLGRSYFAMKNEMLEQGIASSVSQATSTSTDIGWHTDIDFPGKRAGETIEMGAIVVAEDYFKTMGMKIISGRDFTGVNDSNSVIVNEAAVRQMRLTQPIGQIVNFQGEKRIAGVAKDALMISPFSQADPTIFSINPHQQNFLLYRLTPTISPRDAVSRLTSIYNKYNPSSAFTYSFSDEQYAQKFNTELLVGKLSSLFAALAIFISCLGLFGLAAYVAEQRTKEIGIRKVLGASVPQVWLLLSKDFVVLILMSCVIASGLAAYFLQDWLQQYSYRIQLSAGVFVLAAIAALVVTLLTISFQALKAGLANPVKSLRSE